jgi:hypothetical protein
VLAKVAYFYVVQKYCLKTKYAYFLEDLVQEMLCRLNCVLQVYLLLKCCAVSLCDGCPTFRDYVLVSSSRAEKFKKNGLKMLGTNHRVRDRHIQEGRRAHLLPYSNFGL